MSKRPLLSPSRNSSVKQGKAIDEPTRAGPSHAHNLTRHQDAEDAYSIESDQDLANRSKARHLRRLKDRWACKSTGHSHCFTNIETALHIQLTESQISDWVSNIVRAALLHLGLV
jgi:hypothetical protein